MTSPNDKGTPDPQRSIYEQIGEDGIARIVAGFYRRVRIDPILSRLYPEADMEGAEDRLKLFILQYFGGPTTYSQQRGHPRLRMRHMPFQIGTQERDSWINNMIAALDEANIPEPAYSEMHSYFTRAADFMINVPGEMPGNRP